MTDDILPRRDPEYFPGRSLNPIPPHIQKKVAAIVEQVRFGGEAALRDFIGRYDGRAPEQPIFLTKDALWREFDRLPPLDRQRLERIARRIRDFAEAQRRSLLPVTLDVPGGTIGHRIDPVDAAGCYAPGGRYPLPSSVLMTVVTARAAGVDSVWVASPQPAPITLAAAAVAGADGMLAAGGAHAIAALAFGVGPLPASDVVVGPGNLYVTAAKQVLAGSVTIDMLAGPSELVVIADGTANPAWIAADLLAQAEHDPQAVPILLLWDENLIEAVERELSEQLQSLSTAPTARAALMNGGAVLCADAEQAARVSNAIAPEHLQLSVADADDLMGRLQHYGALFIGENSAEVFGDYGVGPNHVLPTSGTARARGGLSVLDFLRVRTWVRLTGEGPSHELLEDAVWLARQEGLEAHARAAECRRFSGSRSSDPVPR